MSVLDKMASKLEMEITTTPRAVTYQTYFVAIRQFDILPFYVILRSWQSQARSEDIDIIWAHELC